MHSFARELLTWYREHKRDLPWRGTRDAYAVWVSEVMLQQTRAETVVPYYLRWMRRFPTPASLARATEQQVMRLWEGLGYYRRALALRNGARQIMNEHGGSVPRDPASLARLPGVGSYTAAAVAAIAFDADEIALDGNLRRVLSRLSNLDRDPRRPEAERMLRQYARRKLPPGHAADFNQALMDLGALICVTREPRCGLCPVGAWCVARKKGLQAQRPVRGRSRRVPEHVATAGVIRRNGRVLIAKRPPGVLLGGLWEFPGGKRRSRESLHDCLRRELREELGVRVRVGERVGEIRHSYSHFGVTVYAFECRLLRGTPAALEHAAIHWAAPSRLKAYPMGFVARRIAQAVSARRKPPDNGRHR
ncbi:MAG TPA: A/G-specific adenine glycosylase [Anaerolineales bacterium]|nr:A/G-specific adenine glycosylase [Anaerolineales bacterium]